MAPFKSICSVLRAGWKGRPVVVLGRREGVPMGLHPLVSFVARPVKHVRLATALLKASALMRSKSQAGILFGLTNIGLLRGSMRMPSATC